MLNQIVLIGRICNDPELRETGNGKYVTNISLAVSRSFRNSEGNYDTDFVTCTLWAGIAKSTVENCKKGELIAIKGRIQTRNYEDRDGKRIYVTEVIAERVTFLSHHSEVLQEEKSISEIGVELF